MKRMFLASSFADVADLLVKFTNGKSAGKTISFIPTASFPEEVKFYVTDGRKALEKLGMKVDELDISTTTNEEIATRIGVNDYIYVAGGNTFYLLQELRRTGADKIITEQIISGKLYIGESAGSIVLSRNIEYVKEMDNFSVASALDSYSSLGLIDFYPLPHYTNPPFKKVVEHIISNYSRKIELCPISNTQAIIVNESEFEVLSK